MGRRYKAGDIDNGQYYQLPKLLLKNPEYKKMSALAKLAYALIKDRLSLSLENGWTDENGDVYLYFKQESLAEELGVSRQTTSKLFKELEQFELIEVVRQGLNQPNKVYIKMLNNFTSGCKKTLHQDVKQSLHQDVKNFDTNKTEYIKTEKNKEKELSKDNSQKTAKPSEGDTAKTSATRWGARQAKEYSANLSEDNEVSTALVDYIDTRQSLRAPITQRAINLYWAKLKEHPPAIQLAMLNNAIEHGWKSVYALKPDEVRGIRGYSDPREMQGSPTGMFDQEEDRAVLMARELEKQMEAEGFVFDD